MRICRGFLVSRTPHYWPAYGTYYHVSNKETMAAAEPSSASNIGPLRGHIPAARGPPNKVKNHNNKDSR
jgi:hypothetical protein